MPQHRETSSSVAVADLLRAGAADAPKRTSHRARPRTADRLKLAASGAVATGALVGTATQIAHAAPILVGGGHDGAAAQEKSSTTTAKGFDQLLLPLAAPAPAAPLVESAPVPAPMPVPAPFGLQNLPPEVAGPLAQAEAAIKNLQRPPLAVRPVSGQESSPFGSRWGAFHSGIDFADPIGEPIHSVASGTVIDAGPASGFGLWVRVKQDDGTTAVYGHVNDILTQVGQRVNVGDEIATVGNRGNSTGPHLHLEIWDANDNKIDPEPYLASKGVVLTQQWGPAQ
ncbi:M23 family metallopeptidase [Nocardia stercoris]|uniref:M23 family metallopeptidase n=1 Tax=Nocardia stercoris TaxID=2483361 RepID=UPI001F4555F9|nr:M23 family metallopeptidase [Nocardia stercoris]